MTEQGVTRGVPLAAHADWSMHPNKRWMCVAVPAGRGWRVELEPARDVDCILPGLRRRAAGAAVAFGVDAPIGLPEAYRHSRTDFRSFLDGLGSESAFFRVAETAADISLDRPFYPNRGQRGARRSELLAGLGLASTDQLLRHCERATLTQPAASPLFWTLGAKQVGKAAICLWRDLLLPALRSADPPALWPADGALADLLRAGRLVVAETYPALAMRQIELGFTGSKTRQADRARVADRLLAILHEFATEPDAALSAAIGNGFGAGADGEDRFDSLLGLLGLLRIIRNPALDHLPDAAICRWEGWILGRPLSTS